MSKMKWAGGLLLLGAVAGAVYWGRQHQEEARPAENLQPVSVRRGDIQVRVQSTGTVKPQNRVEIKPPIAGRVDEVLVREGDRVRAGQIVAWMSSTDRAALLDAARARGEAELRHWKEIYRATPLVAPLDGSIILRNVEPGQTVGTADPLLAMSDVLIVEAQVDETDLALITTGQLTEVVLDAYPEETFTGVVSHVAYEAQTIENVTVYNVEVLPSGWPGYVRSGMTANLTFPGRSACRVLLVPAEAVHEEDGLATVKAPGRDGGPPRPREVQTGLSDGKDIEIVGGLAEGDQVMVPRVQRAGPEGEAKNNPFMPSFGRGRRR